MRPLDHAQAHLLRSLRAVLSEDRQTPSMIVQSIETAAWCSLTFVGNVHSIVLRIAETDPAAFAMRLASLQDGPQGDIVADARIVATEAHVDDSALVITIEVLTIDPDASFVGDASSTSSTSTRRAPRRRTPLANPDAPRMT